MAGRLSVREVERLVRKYINKPVTGKGLPGQQVKAPHIIDMERKLTSQMGTKVSIETRKGGQRGKIIIEFYSLDDFIPHYSDGPALDNVIVEVVPEPAILSLLAIGGLVLRRRKRNSQS